MRARSSSSRSAANFIVGRSDRAHFRLPVKDKSISRIHFMIELNPPQCRLIDMGSTNGTKVNGQKISMADLKNGDLVTAGMSVLLVSVIVGDEPDACPTESFELSLSPGVAETAKSATPPGKPPSILKPDSPGSTRTPQSAVTPLGKPLSTADYPRPARPSNEARSGCQVCADALPESDSGAGAIRLCPACRGRIRNHPQPIPDYQVVRELGQGGMGVVYQALRTADGRLVALKTIKPAIVPSEVDLERFLREARILSALDHPNIVAFHEMGESNGLLHFAMDYVPGIDASQLLKQYGGALPIARAVDVVCQLLQALDYAHAKGFVHRDVKPANMLVTQQGGREFIKLSDFGLSRIYQTSRMSGLTMNGQLGGTLAFMAPEQITELRDTRPPADQYSAGATLYHFLTGSAVYDFPERLEARVMKVLLEDPVPIRSRRPDLPEELALIIHRALMRDPQARFENAREMRRASAPFAT